MRLPYICQNDVDNMHATPFSEKKSQSAMEYLMTYGWAILIIAVVLVALFQMGVFNSANFAPKAQPGSCQVFKTVATTSLEGTCNNEMPEFVANFNSLSSVIATGVTDFPSGSSPRSLFAWIYFTGSLSSGAYNIESYGNATSAGSSGIRIYLGYLNFAAGGDNYQSTFAIPANVWTFVGYTYASGANTVTMYYNGQNQQGALVGGSPLDTPSILTTGYISALHSGTSAFFSGDIANMQLYNTSLSANDVQALYLEGIGGAPQNTQNLVGWWPLNGNANDYSNNLNNGVPTNVIYTGSWTSGYSQP